MVIKVKKVPIKAHNSIMTARTNASKPKLERMLYYKDTKLKRRKRKRKLIRG